MKFKLALDLKKFIRFVLILGLILILHYTNALRPLENLTLRLISPIIKVFYHSGDNLSAALTKTKQDYQNEAEILRAENGKLLVENADLKVAATENIKLREFLGFFGKDQHQHLLANIIARENFLESARSGQSLIIDRGSSNGLYIGLPVTNEEGVVVGKIISVTDRTSAVCLLTSSACKFAVSLLNSDHTFGVSEGDLGLTIKINFVSQSEKIIIGDLAISSGMEATVPAGLLIGRVNRAEIKDNDIWQNVNLEPLADFNNLRIVSVILPN